MKPSDLPGVEHFLALPCGTRAKYIGARCRCLRCRAANRITAKNAMRVERFYRRLMLEADTREAVA